MTGAIAGAMEKWKTAGHVMGLQALAHLMGGDIPDALVPLERALTLAEPEGYVRILVDEGTPMADLLDAAAEHGIATDYVGRLLRAFGKTEDRTRTSTPSSA